MGIKIKNKLACEEFRKITGGKDRLSMGDSSSIIRAINEKCPNPTCTKGTKHCKKCRDEYGIWVCGTSSKGHAVLNDVRVVDIPIESDTLLEPGAMIWQTEKDGGERFERVLVKGDVNHSDKDWSEFRNGSDVEFKRVFNLHNKEIRKRGWVDVRKDKV